MTDRLRPGAALFDVPGRGPVLRDAGGGLLDVALPAPRLDGLRAWWAGAPGPAPDELAAFAEAGHLGDPVRWPEHRRHVLVLGGGPLADAACAALSTAGARPDPVDGPVGVDDVLARGAAAVCALHAGPAPGRWAGLDGLAAAGVAWQRVSVEGRHALLEPVAAAPGDVGHADVRARRLAAAGSGAASLRAYWSAAPHASPAPADMALLGALAARDLRTWAGDAPPAPTGALVPEALPPRRRLRVVDLETGAIADHPVLPVPASAP